jgi:hypothetical protein
MFLGAVILALAGAASTALAGGTDFDFKVARRDVAADPDGIWKASEFSGGRASLYEYELPAPGGALLVSQIWNGDCTAAACPTRLVRLEPGGRRILLVDDTMRQVIPPNDPRFNDLSRTTMQAAFAQHPFRLSADGATLINGDFRFSIHGGTR